MYFFDHEDFNTILSDYFALVVMTQGNGVGEGQQE